MDKSNWILKFKHSNGSDVWFTVYCTIGNVYPCARDIEKRTSFKFLDDYEPIGELNERCS